MQIRMNCRDEERISVPHYTPPQAHLWLYSRCEMWPTIHCFYIGSCPTISELKASVMVRVEKMRRWINWKLMGCHIFPSAFRYNRRMDIESGWSLVNSVAWYSIYAVIAVVKVVRVLHMKRCWCTFPPIYSLEHFIGLPWYRIWVSKLLSISWELV